jgi:CRP/FNR family transcriptional regulator, anaerobic regulatory protein
MIFFSFPTFTSLLSFMETRAEFQKLKEFYRSLMPGLTTDGWCICESMLTVRRLKKGEILHRQGAVCNQVSFVNYGLIRMYAIYDNGKEKTFDFAKEGDYTGDYRSFLLREPANTSLQALEDTEVVETTYEGLQSLYKQVPEANVIGRLVAEDLFIDMCLRTSGQGMTIDEQYRDMVERQPWLLQRVPQYLIASYLGVTPEAFSRIKARATKKSRKIPLTPTATAVQVIEHSPAKLAK